MTDASRLSELTAVRDEVMGNVIKEAQRLADALVSLPEVQRAAAVGLVLLGQAVAAHSRSQVRRNAVAAEAFTTLVGKLSPVGEVEPIGGRLLRGCIDESIAYASAMARCEQEGKTTEQCDQENWQDAAKEVDCQLRALDKLRGFMQRLTGRPPWPQPPPI